MHIEALGVIFIQIDGPKHMHAKFGVDWCSGVSRTDETKVTDGSNEGRKEGRTDGSDLDVKVKGQIRGCQVNRHV